MSNKVKIPGPIDLFGNKIHRGKVAIVDRNIIADDDLIDKKFVTDSLIYASTLSDTATFNQVSEIDNKTLVVDQPVNDVLDALFFPLILHDYIKPTSDVGIVVEETLSTLDVTNTLLEVGKSIHFEVENIVTINDSQGLLDVNPYEYNIETSSGVVVTQSALSSYQSADIAIGTETTFYVVSKYKDAVLLNDSHGNPDAIGTAENPIFLANQLDDSIVVNAVWPTFLSIFSTAPPVLDATNMMATLESGDISGRYLESDDTVLNKDLDIDNTNGTKTIVFAVRKDPGVTSYKINVTRNSENISSLFTESTLIDVPDASGGGFLETYIIFSAELPMIITEDYELKITTTKIS